MSKGKDASGTKLIAQNRKARHDYEIEETLEAGIALLGTEVKSCRAGKVSLTDAYGSIEDNEVWLVQAHIAPYSHGNLNNHEPLRRRKLLLHGAEIERLRARVEQEGRSLIPLRMHFRNGKAKVELGVGRGRKLYDKRRDIAKRSDERRMRQELGRRR